MVQHQDTKAQRHKGEESFAFYPNLCVLVPLCPCVKSRLGNPRKIVCEPLCWHLRFSFSAPPRFPPKPPIQSALPRLISPPTIPCASAAMLRERRNRTGPSRNSGPRP